MFERTAEILGHDVEFLMGGFYPVFRDKVTGEILANIGPTSFDINLVSAITKSRDKVLASEIMDLHDIPNISHKLLTLEKIAHILTVGLEHKVVIKGIRGGGGKHIYFADNNQEFLDAICNFSSYKLTCISKHYNFNKEYRCTVLDGKVLNIFAKGKDPNTGQHNLSVGATVTEVVAQVGDLFKETAIKATQVLGLRTANVDMFYDEKGVPTVMEVNSGVHLSKYAEHKDSDVNTFEVTCQVYAQIVDACIKTNQKLRQTPVLISC